MKQINFWTLLSLLFLSVAMFSCSENNGFDDDDDNNNNNSSNSDNKLKEGQIELKGYSNDKTKVLFFSAKADKITIDWGDGSKIDVITPNGVEVRCSHEYANQNFQTVSITTEKLTYLRADYHAYDLGWTEVRIGSCLDLQEADFRDNYAGNNITVLNIKNAPSLTTLNCGSNRLTSLDVSGCKALTSLYCSHNQLTASALNALFQSLPTVESGTIYCYPNPGYGTCDISIAEKKGWKFYW